MAFMQKQMDRGCGLMTFHFATFAPDKYGDKVLDWAGGYFDWENEKGEREWYSDIKFLEVEVEMPSDEHPVMNGVKPFTIFEEYYFDIRFIDDDPRLTPIVNVSELESERKWGGVVAWAIDRGNGNRGFGTTMGHLYSNWKNPDYRKLFLNAIIWTAGGTVPEGGVETRFYSDQEASKYLYNTDYKGLILTGHNYPGHPWQETTPVLKNALEKDGTIHVDISTNINDLQQYDLRDYDFIVFNYCNW
jgi:type 1 glutamine amidotransferase